MDSADKLKLETSPMLSIAPYITSLAQLSQTF